MLMPVEGNKGLFRDGNSGAILNCSNSDYEKYLELKNTKIKEFIQINDITEKINEIDTLKSDINEMKEMMKFIVNKLESNS
jgi:hypothetical protein